MFLYGADDTGGWREIASISGIPWCEDDSSASVLSTPILSVIVFAAAACSLMVAAGFPWWYASYTVAFSAIMVLWTILQAYLEWNV